MKRIVSLIALALALSVCLSATAQAATQEVANFGQGGWRSDDTRDVGGADLVGLYRTNAGKPGQAATEADDLAIAEQLQFVDGPAGSTYGGALKIIAPNDNAAKSTISVVDTGGIADASTLVDGSFSAAYKWYMEPNPTTRTLAFRVGIQSTMWAQSQAGFTAVRSGESAWDLILVHTMDGATPNAWQTPTVDMNNGTWNLYAQAGNGNWVALVGEAPAGGSVEKTLADWQADPVWGPVLFGPGAKATSVQLGLGSWQRQCNAYVDYLVTSLLNDGDVIDFTTDIFVEVGTRLADLQNDDGGWDWPLDDGNPANASPLNTVGPIAKGLAEAYLKSGDPRVLAALQQAGAFLLAKTNNFSPSDGYLAAQLDDIFGGTAYVDHVTANFYDPLAAGTYDRNGAGTLYDTAGYVDLIRTGRSGNSANLAAWDIGMGLVGAAACGADNAPWIAGVKAEIDELDAAGYYDVIGLAGAVYGLATVGEDFDPTSGEHAAASSISDLADILVSYQIPETGGFTYDATSMTPNDHERVQVTAYAILALDELDRGGYRSAIIAAGAYIADVQLTTGGFADSVGGGENNEVTAEGAWGYAVASQTEAVLTLNVDPAPLYVQPGEAFQVTLDVSDLVVPVTACQAIVGYDSARLTATGLVEGNLVDGGPWDDMIYDVFTDGTPVAGEVDTAVGVLGSSTSGTMQDSVVAGINFTAGGTVGATEWVTNVWFRPDVDPEFEATFFSDENAQKVWPSKADSQQIIIDGVQPTLAITSVTQPGRDLFPGSDNALVGTVTITVQASDWGDLDGRPAVTVTDADSNAMAVTDAGDNGADEFYYTVEVSTTTANGTATIDASVSDMAGNTSTDSATFNVNKRQITGTVTFATFSTDVYAVSRDVVFVATDASDTVLATWTETVDFTNDTGTQTASGTYLLTDVPAGVDNLSAKTAWHLRTRNEGVSGSFDGNLQLVTDFTLLGGDLNGTNSVNILDYTLLKTNWYATYDASDINGDGTVQLRDYDLMKSNWYVKGDAE